MPRSPDFWTEYGRYITTLSVLKGASSLSLQSPLGLAESEIISPCNPDTLYLRILTQICILLLSDLLAKDGDTVAHQNCLNAAKDVAKVVRLMRSAGRPQVPGQEVSGSHEIQTPFIMAVSLHSHDGDHLVVENNN